MPDAPVRPAPVTGATRSQPLKRPSAVLWIVAFVVLLGVGGFFGARSDMAANWSADRNVALRRGVRLWREGKAEIAAAEFAAAARQLPKKALPHIYLSRLARERGDLTVAFAEAGRAAQLEPNNALALREVGSVLLARTDYDGARRFFVRALRANPGDRAAMGWLACSLHRLGEADQAARWSSRAGAGGWSSCLP